MGIKGNSRTRKRKRQERTSLDAVFELVATSLQDISNTSKISDRDGNGNDDSRSDDSGQSVPSLESRSNPEGGKRDSSSCSDATKRKTITLPCIKFMKEEKKLTGEISSTTNREHSFLMTISFVMEANPSKSYIHCLFSDKMGEDGKIGPMTFNLL